MEASGKFYKENADWVSLNVSLCKVHDKGSIVTGSFYYLLYCLLEVKFDTGLEFLALYCAGLFLKTQDGFSSATGRRLVSA